MSPTEQFGNPRAIDACTAFASEKEFEKWLIAALAAARRAALIQDSAKEKAMPFVMNSGKGKGQGGLRN